MFSTDASPWGPHRHQGNGLRLLFIPRTRYAEAYCLCTWRLHLAVINNPCGYGQSPALIIAPCGNGTHKRQLHGMYKRISFLDLLQAFLFKRPASDSLASVLSPSPLSFFPTHSPTPQGRATSSPAAAARPPSVLPYPRCRVPTWPHRPRRPPS